MKIKSKSAGYPLVMSFIEWLADRIRTIQEARIRRREHSDKFYRDLKNYCRANNLTAVCEDDSRTRR